VSPLQAVSAWVYDLIVVVALAAVVEMLLPSGGFRRFAMLVMGLLVVLALTKPLLGYMQAAMPVSGGTLNVAPDPSSGGFVFSAEGAGFPSADAALRDSLGLHLARLVAASLGIDAREVSVEVGLEGRSGWPGLIRYMRVRILRAPEALIQGWLSSQEPLTQDPAGASGREQAISAIAGALQSQLAAIYHLDPAEIQVVMPR
jgi:stage III sporulation protein AF